MAAPGAGGWTSNHPGTVYKCQRWGELGRQLQRLIGGGKTSPPPSSTMHAFLLLSLGLAAAGNVKREAEPTAEADAVADGYQQHGGGRPMAVNMQRYLQEALQKAKY